MVGYSRAWRALVSRRTIRLRFDQPMDPSVASHAFLDSKPIFSRPAPLTLCHHPGCVNESCEELAGDVELSEGFHEATQRSFAFF